MKPFISLRVALLTAHVLVCSLPAQGFGSEEIRRLIEDYDQSPGTLDRLAPSERASRVEEMMGLLLQGLAEPRDEASGPYLNRILTLVAKYGTDAQVVRAGEMCAEDLDHTVRATALRSLGNSRSTAAADVFISKIGRYYDKIAVPPYGNLGESRRVEASKASQDLFWCILGLVQSSSEAAQKVGWLYLNLLREKFSKSEEGREGLAAFEAEFRRFGVDINRRPTFAEESSPISPIVPRDPLVRFPTATPSSLANSTESEGSSRNFLPRAIALVALASLFAILFRKRKRNE